MTQASNPTFYLMCYNGNVLHHRNGKYYTKAVNEINENDALKIHLDSAYVDFNKEDWYIFSKQHRDIECYSDIFSNLKMNYNSDTRAFSLCNKDGKYLCFEDNNLDFTRDQANLWESFLPISNDFIDKIKYVLSNKWLSKRTGQLFDGKDITFREQFLMKIGEFSLDIRSQRVSDFGKYNLMGFCDSWKIEEFLLYNPLIYITAYSSKSVLEQLKICIRSLREFSGFDGQIVVMSDQDVTSIRELCAGKNTDSINVDPMNPEDFVGYVCSKFSLSGKECYDGYQPIMYLDPDIVFNCNVDQMLQEATLTEDICAPLRFVGIHRE